MQNKLLSILMPVYNESAYIRRIIDRVLAVELPVDLDRELVIVDDGSTDGTVEMLEQIAAQHPDEIRLFLQPYNQGKGAAVARAIEEMKGDIAVFQDADLEYDPEDYKQLLEPLLNGRADVVYGSRFASAGSRRVLNFHHEIINRLLTTFSNVTTGLNLTDMETCYKAFKADILRTIPLRSLRFGIEPEITAKVAKRHCVVYEVPISYHGRAFSEGKKIGWKDGVEALWVIMKYWMVDDCYNERYGHYILNSLASTHRFNSWMVKTIEPFLGRRILEVGSGIANISRLLPKRELLTLSDCDDEYVRLLRQAFTGGDGVNVVKLDLNSDADFAAVEDKYDSIVCLNVLEHIEDDLSALKRMSGLLQPGGKLIILVPQHELLMSKIDHDLGHFRRYSRDSLSEVFEEAGLQVEELQDFNALAALGWLVSNKLMGRRSLGRLQLKVFDSLVPILSLLEPQLPVPGVSLIAVASPR